MAVKVNLVPLNPKQVSGLYGFLNILICKHAAISAAFDLRLGKRKTKEYLSHLGIPTRKAGNSEFSAEPCVNVAAHVYCSVSFRSLLHFTVLK